ncbi:Guanine nucleotide-binding protein alpha-2 subunit [Microbotryomycetes sp. JL201]|nr:Guanine nucleotide-binding protein alpha-2 subunit [Microbotryomycetes sp. JL201]
MGCVSSSTAHASSSAHDVPKDVKDRSYQIDKQIDDDAKKFRRECKILLLGSGESGKSTIVKQMKIIHQNGYSRDEMLLFRLTIYKNVIDSAQTLVLALRRFKMEPIESVNRAFAEQIAEYRLETDTYSSSPSLTGSPATSGSGLSPEIVDAIDSLWHDPIIPSREQEAKYGLALGSFFDEIKRIGAPGYVPNEADVLRARTKTTGISETKFKSGQLSIHMFDVGGQRSERKKWIHCFEAVTSIIFCVALSEYDQVLLEENGQNRMNESLVLFESVINSRWFLRTSIILFLNKIDLFKAKLPKVPLEKYFPEYTGGPDVNKGAKYILWRFTQLNRARLSIYPHLTQATDTSNIRLVFAAVKETILQNALRDSGIL